jgi:hypothetical protein
MTSTLSDATSFGPMQLGMEFDGEEASCVTDAPAYWSSNIVRQPSSVAKLHFPGWKIRTLEQGGS